MTKETAMLMFTSSLIVTILIILGFLVGGALCYMGGLFKYSVDPDSHTLVKKFSLLDALLELLGIILLLGASLLLLFRSASLGELQWHRWDAGKSIIANVQPSPMDFSVDQTTGTATWKIPNSHHVLWASLTTKTADDVESHIILPWDGDLKADGEWTFSSSRLKEATEVTLFYGNESGPSPTVIKTFAKKTP